MPRVRTRKATDLDVVAHQIVFGRELVDRPFEILLLVIPAWSPGKNAADVEVLAEDVPHHVLGGDPFGRRFVVLAAGCVDVMIAADPTEIADLDPPLEPERLAVILSLRHLDCPLQNSILRP